MRTVNVQFLSPKGKVVWVLLPWGKIYLDWYRDRGYTILYTEQKW